MNEFDHNHLHNVDGKYRRPWFDIHKAAIRGDLGRVRQFIEAGVPVDILNVDGETPLHLAAKSGQYEVAALLINSNCDLELKNFFGQTPLMLATFSRKKEIVDLLIHRGAQVNWVGFDGWSLLHHASYNTGWTESVRLILNNGKADLNVVNRHGIPPLMWAVIKGHEEVTALLVRAGADVNIIDDQKRTVLHEAVIGGHMGVIKILLEKEGLDLNTHDCFGLTPLHYACQRRFPVAIRLLLDAGTDINMKNNQGETALSEGIRYGNLTHKVIKLIVQKGAFLSKCDYMRISRNPFLKENILKDVEFCTQSIVNKFHHHNLPTLNSITYFARRLPNVNNFKLQARDIDEVKGLVKCEIERNTFCDVVKVHPIALSALCVLSLITCQSGKKRPASPDFGHSPFKKIHN